MKIDLAKYSNPCSCGKKHNIITKEIIIEKNATDKIFDTIYKLGLKEKGVLICDTNTKIFADEVREKLNNILHKETPIVCLEANGLHANEKAVEMLENLVPEDALWLVAVGSGTIHDITRYLANESRIDFISYPTAATVDGYVSTVCAMTWYGFKKTMPGVAPLAVIADTEIFANAPYSLTIAGIGDVLGKFTCLADWEISHLVTNEPICYEVIKTTREAVAKVYDNLDNIYSKSYEGMESLMFALLLSGISMQMWGNSRPASGAEHHMSHLWEMEVFNPQIDALHGEKVGVGLNLALKEYKKILNIKLTVIKEYLGLPKEELKEKFSKLYNDILIENTPDLLESIELSTLEQKLPKIFDILEKLPDSEVVKEKMARVGCKVSLEDICLNDSIKADTLEFSPFVRNRLTLMRLKKLFS